MSKKKKKSSRLVAPERVRTRFCGFSADLGSHLHFTELWAQNAHSV